MLTKDDLIREYRNRRGTLSTLVLVYGMIVATMVFSAMAMTG